LIDKILKTIKDNKMFEKGDKVIVAVSGGPDSLCLLKVLYDLRNDLEIKISVAHLNHCLRGKDADKDEEYVKEFCAQLNIDFYSKKVDVSSISKKQGLSCEMAGRSARYGFFEEIRQQIHANKIAIAHNANDQAETILMRVMRGTGLTGLMGISPVRDNVYIRPLIKVTRDEIEAYCTANKLNPKIDKTNFENIYGRNKVRLELIPYIKKKFNTDIVMTLNRLSDTLRVDNEYMESISLQKYKLYCKENEKKVTIHKEVFSQPDAILTRLIRLSISYLKGSTYDFEKKHIIDIIDLERYHGTGTVLSLPSGIEAYNNYGDINLCFSQEVISKDISEYELELHKTNVIAHGKIKVKFRILNKDEVLNFRENKFIKYFNYDKIKEKITLRYRRDGDRFNPIGMSGTKKIKDIFIDMKVEKKLRDKIPLICFGSEIAWITGYMVSDRYKVKENTKKILEIKYEGEEA
jgi:tRNA(Ile)-lysidine synthase